MFRYYATILKNAQRESRRLIREHIVAEMIIAAATLVASAIMAPDGLAKALIPFGITVAALLMTAGLFFLWSLAWAPVNHSRGLEIIRQRQNERYQQVQEDFEHLHKYGNLLLAMLEGLVQDETLFLKWERVAHNWERLLTERAKTYLTPFERQRLKSTAGLTLRSLPNASLDMNRYYQHLDAIVQRLERLLEAQPWKNSAPLSPQTSHTPEPDSGTQEHGPEEQ